MLLAPFGGAALSKNKILNLVVETFSQKENCLSKSSHFNHFLIIIDNKNCHSYTKKIYSSRIVQQTDITMKNKTMKNICVGGFQQFTILLVLFVAFNFTIKYSHNTTTTQPFKRPSTGRLETTILESIKYTTRPDSTALCTCYDDLTPIILR